MKSVILLFNFVLQILLSSIIYYIYESIFRMLSLAALS